MTRAEAFEKSLKKWEDIIEGVPGVNPWSRCALCDTYYNSDQDSCNLCPLYPEFECDSAASPWMKVSFYYDSPTHECADKDGKTEIAMAMYLALLMARDGCAGMENE